MFSKMMVVLSSLMMTHAIAAPNFKGLTYAREKLTIDFSKSLLNFNDSDKDKLLVMKAIAVDFSYIQKLVFKNLVLSLRPVENMKDFDVFFSFRAVQADKKEVQCYILAQLKSESYSGGCDSL